MRPALPLLAFLLTMPAAARAEWDWGTEIYLWGAGLGGEAATGEEIDVPFSEVADRLELAGMARIVAHKDEWTLFADFFYVDLGDNATIPARGPRAATADVDLDIDQFFTTVGAGHRVVDSGSHRAQMLGGVRYTSVDTVLDYRRSDGFVFTGRDELSTLDAVVGVQGVAELSERWYLTYYADIGGGESDLTWLVRGAVAYRFNHFDLALGYSHVEWDFGDGELTPKLDLSGPYLGLRFGF